MRVRAVNLLLMTSAIGIDLGGTNLRVARVDQQGRVQASTHRPSPVREGPEAMACAMAEMAREVSAARSQGEAGGEGGTPLGIGIGSPGPLSRSERKIFQTPHLPGFENFPIGARVEELSGLKVRLDNDAKCAAYGEATFGEGRGLKNFILLTFGTGIGGGVFIDGKMMYGKSDGACEIGHMTLHPGGRPCPCGNRGCFEEYSSSRALARRAGESFGRGDSQAGARPLEARDVIEAFDRGEGWTHKPLRDFADDLALGLASLVNIFDPEAIILGGGLFTTGGGPLAAWAHEGLRERCFKSSQRGLKVTAAKLRGEAGVVGAASLFLRELL